jgi:hypothetical protein
MVEPDTVAAVDEEMYLVQLAEHTQPVDVVASMTAHRRLESDD